jgi:hypothetical protein
MKRTSAFLALAALCLAGCNTFTLSQVDSFIDEDGNLVRVEYGSLKRPRKYTVVSPANGREIECQSALMVRMRLPDGVTVPCYYTQNDFAYGTMYKSADSVWKYFTTGLECAAFRFDPAANDYLLVYKGSACGNVDNRPGAKK